MTTRLSLVPRKPTPLLLDTGGWLRALEGDDAYAAALTNASVAIVPAPILAEIDYHLRKRRRDAYRLLREITEGRYDFVEATVADVARAAELDKKFSDVALGFVDAAVAAIGERIGVRRILTIDSDFAAIRVGPRSRDAFEMAVPLP
jgi:predicted nucleic acid-binding protein